MIQPQDNGLQDRDPAERSVAVGNPQSCFQIGLLTAPVEIDGTPSVQLDTGLTRDGQVLQEGIDYVREVDPAGEILTIRPVSGMFDDGSYRISVEQAQFHVAVKASSAAASRVTTAGSRGRASQTPMPAGADDIGVGTQGKRVEILG